MLDEAHLDTWDRDNLLHSNTAFGQFARGEAPRRTISTANGVRIEDADGETMIDAFAGLYCVNIGYGQQAVIDAISAQANQLPYYHSYVGHGTEASITLAKMVVDRAPDHMSKVFFGLTGSDANDTNLKLIWYYNNILGRTEKKKIIARERAYHGSGLTTGSLTGLPTYHKKFDLPLDRILHVSAPCYFRRPDTAMSEAEFTTHLLDELEARIIAEGPETVAAFVAEPVLGTGGLIPPPEGYWAGVSAILEKYDILLVADEVVTGFGRLGTMFGSDYYHLKPDFMTIAKGLTSAYAPLSGSIISDRVWQVLEAGTDEFGPFGHGSTYSAHPLCAAAGVANLQVLDDQRLIDNVNAVGPYFGERMRTAIAGHSHCGEVRSIGLLAAVELVKDPVTREPFDPAQKIAPAVAGEMLKHGVIARAMPHSDIIGFAPPFCLNKADADVIVEVTQKAIHSVLGD